jgi:ubiquinone biosynthesis protein Coq4
LAHVPAHRHHFESAQSAQTLAQGLAEYFAANPSLKRDDTLQSSQARQFFRSHDVVHVVYGCGTTMPDEAVVKLASLFGTTGGLHVLRGYMNDETLDIYSKLPLGSTLLALASAPYLIVRTLWRCARQHRRWPWSGYEQYLDTPLHELRSRFGITVAHPRNDA